MPGPLIGVSIGRLPVNTRHLDGTNTEYSRPVARCGGIPVLLPAIDSDDPGAVVERLDGVLLTGGGDIDPRSYGQEPSPVCGGVNPVRDRVERSVIERALDLGRPILGVCRGLQMLNVALGGTLIKHIPDRSPLDHVNWTPRNRLVHQVQLEPQSYAARIMGRSELRVNSVHHQAIDRLATRLQAVGWAEDGLIEAVEVPGEPVVAVQWHPESLVPNPPHLALFQWLVDAAAGKL